MDHLDEVPGAVRANAGAARHAVDMRGDLPRAADPATGDSAGPPGMIDGPFNAPPLSPPEIPTRRRRCPVHASLSRGAWCRYNALPPSMMMSPGSMASASSLDSVSGLSGLDHDQRDAVFPVRQEIPGIVSLRTNPKLSELCLLSSAAGLGD